MATGDLTAERDAPKRPIRTVCCFCEKVHQDTFASFDEARAIAREHIMSCPAHPLAAALAVNAELLAALRNMRWFAVPGMHWTDEVGRQALADADAAIARATGTTDGSD